MVYYGTLSKGCEECRNRKIKCDGRRPGCERCEKYRRRCPGYRDLSAAAFRDENQRIARRVANKQGSQLKPARTDRDGFAAHVETNDEPQPCSQGSSAAESCSRAGEKLENPQQQPRQDLILSAAPVRIGRDEGLCYFHEQFSWETVPRHFAQWSGSPEALINTSAALGLAMLSFARRSPALERKAYAEYGAALQLVNQSLSAPATSSSDSTLAIIILMSFFEIITGCSVSSMSSWTNHASGAASIIQIRGPAQLDSPIGYQLFLEAKGMMITTSLMYKTPLSETLSELTRVAMEREPPSVAHAGRMFIILAELANLRADLQAGSVEGLDRILLRVNAIESKLVNWKETLPPDWKHDPMQIEDHDGMVETRYGRVRPYGGFYFVYKTNYIANGWNNYCIARILLGEVLLNGFKPIVSTDRSGTTMLRTTCVTVRRDMIQAASEICASVPFVLGLLPSTPDEWLSIGGGVMALLPLWFAACVEGVKHPLRQNAALLFGLIAERTGIAHALLQMRALTNIAGMAEWLDNLSPGDGFPSYDDSHDEQNASDEE